MEKKIKIGVRILAMGFFIQPLLIFLIISRIYEGPNPGALYAIVGFSSLLCIAVGIAVWKYAPRFFFDIFQKFTGEKD